MKFSINIRNNELIGYKMLLPSIVTSILLSLLIAYSYFWSINNIHEEKLSLALSEARANWNKDSSLRKWATQHGGIYVKPNKRTPPNPYLSHLPDRDVVTTTGIKLTLMNPAYIMSQITEEFEQGYGIKGKITGKKQLNPKNSPDSWQLKALDLFESGHMDELYEQQTINNEPYLRYMKPMYMSDGCVKCHGHLGFKTGDLRGGISVSIPLSPYFNAALKTREGVLNTHLIIWALSILAIIFFTLSIRKLLAHMAHSTMYDEMTKLPNSILFKNRLEHAFKKSKRDSTFKFAVCFMDLDRFKNLNDSYGHAAGDMLLIELSSRMKSIIRPADTVSRMGGDEFLFLLEGINNLTEPLAITSRILSSFKQPFNINNLQVFSNTSIGICMSSKEYNNIEEMIRDADIAMYRAKEAGKGRVDIFNPEMHDLAKQTMLIENDLQFALARNELDVYYQPVIDTKYHTIDGFEALIRWKHPTIGFIAPDIFIPIAERNGLINTIGEWVLIKACSQVREWSLQFNPENEFSIAVNLSGIQLCEPSITQSIEEIIKATKIDKSKLYLEVTETTLIHQQQLAAAAMSNLKESGILFSIDDFGTGYCSLTYLQTYEFDILKIDKSFTQNISEGEKGLKLVRTLLLLARDLKMKVVAEGVETADQANRLIAMGCPFIQGYYYSKPLSAEKMKKILSSGFHLNAKKLISFDPNETQPEIKSVS
ncbi:MAG: EAL domain-containing protein [Gammaproteobacteria bacterium]|nr:EAL domain-containing protein [Gammaproteobacteria bacterium]